LEVFLDVVADYCTRDVIARHFSPLKPIAV
jgi:hypothetical protein